MTVKIYSSGWQIGKTIRAYTNGAWQKIKTMKIFHGGFLDWRMVYPDVPRYIGSLTLTNSRPGGLTGVVIPTDVLSFEGVPSWSQLDYELADSYVFSWRRTIGGVPSIIPGQTTSNYVVQPSDIGYTFSCKSDATNERGTSTVTSFDSNVVVNPTYTLSLDTDSDININVNGFIGLDNQGTNDETALVGGRSLRYWSGNYTQHSLFIKSDSTTYRIYHQLTSISGGNRDLRVVIVFTQGSNIAEIYIVDALSNTADIFGTAPWRAYQFDGTGINSYQTHLVNYKYNVPMTYGAAVTSTPSSPYPISDIPTVDNDYGWIRLFDKDGAPTGGTSVHLRSNLFYPTELTSLTAVRSGSNQASISWSGSNANSYQYLITYGGGTLLTSGSTTSTSIIISGMVVGTTYSITVTPNSRSDFTGASGNSSSIFYIHPGPPSAPTSLSAIPGGGQVTLSWVEPSSGGSPITDYIIEYKLNSSSTWSVISDGTNTNTSYVVTGLTNGTSYNFRVAAVNIYGTSGYSNIVTATPGTVPGKVTNITGTPGVGTLSLSWTPPADTGGYPITAYTAQLGINWNGSTGTWLSQFIYNGSNTSTSFSGLSAGTTYYARVRAENALGNGLYEVSTGFTIPTVPGQVSSILGSNGGNKSLSVSWSPPANNGGSPITSYTAQAGTASAGAWLSGSIYIGSSTSTTFSGLGDYTQYWVRVRATNAVGDGLYLVAGPWRTAGFVPSAPLNFGGVRGTRLVTLSWSPPSYNGGAAVTSYTVQYKRNNSATWLTASTNASSPYAVTGLTSGVIYNFRVAARNIIGLGPYTNAINRTPQ